MPLCALPDGRTPVVLSAHTEDLVRADASAVLNYLHRAPTVMEVAAQLLRTRRIRKHRSVIRAADRDELAAALRAVAAGQEHPLVARSAAAGAGRLAFIFPGQGNQWPGMGADAYRELAGYRAVADSCADAFVAAGKASPLPYLTGSAGAQQYSELEIEGAQFVHAVGLAHLWQSCGIAPDLTVGHSLGEVAAAYVAGAMSLPDAVAVISARAGVVDLLPGRYAVAALGVTVDAARGLIAGIDGWLELSVVNASASVAVSGDRDAVLAAVAAVVADGRFAREITVGFPVHTSVLEPLRDSLRAQLPDREFIDTAVQFIGSAIGDVVAPGTRFTDYWYGNLRDMVRFDRAVAAAIRCGATSFVELSAHPALLSAISEALPDEPAVLVGSGRRDVPVLAQLSANIAAAATADPRFIWRSHVEMNSRHLQCFPNAPMRRVHLWARPEPLPALAGLTIAAEQWRPIRLPERAVTQTPRPVAVVALGPGSLADELRGALARHPGAVPVSAADAETLIVLAPAPGPHRVAAAAAELAAMVDDGLLD
ncbi:MAG: acyltransferase domain-containing protein, partial [Mycobacterium sp.]